MAKVEGKNSSRSANGTRVRRGFSLEPRVSSLSGGRSPNGELPAPQPNPRQPYDSPRSLHEGPLARRGPDLLSAHRLFDKHSNEQLELVNPLAGSGSWPSLWSTFPSGRHDRTQRESTRISSPVVAHDAATVVWWQALACHCGGTCRSPSRQRIDRISYESGRDRMAVDNGDPGVVPAPVDCRAANARSAGVSHCDRAVATPARIPPRRPSGPRELSRATNSRQGSPQPVHQDARPHGELATDPSVIGGRLARRASPTPRSHRRHEWRTRHGSVQPATDRGSSVAAGA